MGPYGTKASRLEYDRLIGEWLAAGRPSAITAPQNEITVMEVAAAFLKHAKLQYRKHGRSTGTAENFRPVLALLRTRYGHTRAADFGPLALKALQAAMLQEGSSRRYINEYPGGAFAEEYPADKVLIHHAAIADEMQLDSGNACVRCARGSAVHRARFLPAGNRAVAQHNRSVLIRLARIGHIEIGKVAGN